MIRSLRLALSFLTVLPFRSSDKLEPAALGKAAGWFSLVGALIGGITAGAYYALQLIFPPILSAALAVTVWIWLTGGLHLDGVADCFDGMLVSASPQRRLEIMKDPQHGTFGVIGLVVLLKIIALYDLEVSNYWLVLPFASALSRWLILPAGKQTSARPGGLGDNFSSGLHTSAFILGIIPVLILAVLLGWQAGLAAALASGFCLLIIGFARSRLGGLTGDVFGLIVELCEVLVLIVFCLRF